MLSVTAGCKRTDAVGPQASPPSSNDEKDGSDTPDKPAPVAGAYLTSVLVKPKDPSAADICVQLRANDGRRYIDADVNKGHWSYVPPAGVARASYTVSIVPLTNKPQHYYCHADVKVKVTSGFGLTGSSSAGAMTQILGNMHMIFVPPTGKALKGITPLNSTRQAQLPNNPFDTPPAIVSSPDGAFTELNATVLGAIFAPQGAQPATLAPANPNLATSGGVPTSTQFANYTPVADDSDPTAAAPGQDYTSLFSTPFPDNPNVGAVAASDPAIQTDPGSAQAPNGTDGQETATGTSTLTQNVDCPVSAVPNLTKDITQDEISSIRVLAEGDVSPAQYRCSDPAQIDAHNALIASGHAIVTLDGMPFSGCAYPCEWPLDDVAP